MLKRKQIVAKPTPVVVKKRKPVVSVVPPPLPSPQVSVPPPTPVSVVPQEPLPQTTTLLPGPNRGQREAQAGRELLSVLYQRWPAMFPEDPQLVKPLALGIHHELQAHLPDAKPYMIRRALGLFMTRTRGAYRRALLQGGPRYGLDGTARGEVSAAEQEHARMQLARWQGKKNGKRPPKMDAPA
jgi:hypothetical protein